MAEPVLEGMTAAVLWIFGGILTLLGWISNRQVTRIDGLETRTAEKADIIRLHDKIDTNHRAITERLDKLIDKG